jgi:hypothetical protein
MPRIQLLLKCGPASRTVVASLFLGIDKDCYGPTMLAIFLGFTLVFGHSLINLPLNLHYLHIRE